MFNKYSKNRKKLTFALLVLAIYNIIAIVEGFSFVKNYLDFFKLTLLFVIDYYNKIIDLIFLILKVLNRTFN